MIAEKRKLFFSFLLLLLRKNWCWLWLYAREACNALVAKGKQTTRPRDGLSRLAFSACLLCHCLHQHVKTCHIWCLQQLESSFQQ